MTELDRIKQAMADGDLAWCVERIEELEGQLAVVNAFCERFINAYPDWRDEYEALAGGEDGSK